MPPRHAGHFYARHFFLAITPKQMGLATRRHQHDRNTDFSFMLLQVRA